MEQHLPVDKNVSSRRIDKQSFTDIDPTFGQLACWEYIIMCNKESGLWCYVCEFG
jgi:hypothetical protein